LLPAFSSSNSPHNYSPHNSSAPPRPPYYPSYYHLETCKPFVAPTMKTYPCPL
jgi:hypothetical protein